MTCKDKARLLEAYVDGELDIATTLGLEEHLQSCAPCKAALARLNGLRTALRGHASLEAAPASLRARLQARFTAPVRGSGADWRWGLTVASPGIAALALALWLAWSAADTRPPAADTPASRVVYHISNSATAGVALRNLANHLNASPHVKIVVVAHNDGVDFLLRGARDEFGQPVEPVVGRFRERGVEFRVCGNTLERRRIDASHVIPAASLVPSGIAEIGRLQTEEGFAYMRL